MFHDFETDLCRKGQSHVSWRFATLTKEWTKDEKVLCLMLVIHQRATGEGICGMCLNKGDRFGSFAKVRWVPGSSHHRVPQNRVGNKNHTHHALLSAKASSACAAHADCLMFICLLGGGCSIH